MDYTSLLEREATASETIVDFRRWLINGGRIKRKLIGVGLMRFVA